MGNNSTKNQKERKCTSGLDQMKIVLLGKTGSGKSSVGNTIFGGGEEFKTGSSANYETVMCEAKTKDINGKKITVVDTPGFFDANISEKQLKSLLDYIIECASGPLAFLIVLRVDRYIDQEEDIVTKILKYVSSDTINATVLFTYGDQLSEGQTIQDFVEKSSKLKKLVDKCGGRCHVVDNKDWNSQQDNYRNNQKQVSELLNTIEKMGPKEGCFDSEFFEILEKVIEKEKQSAKKSNRKLSEEEIDELAKKKTGKKILKQLSGLETAAGVAAGTVLGALLGVAMSLPIVLYLAGMPLQTFIRKAAEVVVGGAGGAAVEKGETIQVGMVLGVAVVGFCGGIRGWMIGADAVTDSETLGEAINKTTTAVFNEAEAMKRIIKEIKERMQYLVGS